jgi:hypothetical protein
MIVEIVVIQGTEIGPTTGIVDSLHSRQIGIKELILMLLAKWETPEISMETRFAIIVKRLDISVRIVL